MEVTQRMFDEDSAVVPSAASEERLKTRTALLLVWEPDEAGQYAHEPTLFRIGLGETKVGKQPGIVNRLVLKSPNVSRQHCTLFLSPEGKLTVIDNNSSNGTWVGPNLPGGDGNQPGRLNPLESSKPFSYLESFTVGDVKIQFCADNSDFDDSVISTALHAVPHQPLGLSLHSRWSQTTPTPLTDVHAESNPANPVGSPLLPTPQGLGYESDPDLLNLDGNEGGTEEQEREALASANDDFGGHLVQTQRIDEEHRAERAHEGPDYFEPPKATQAIEDFAPTREALQPTQMQMNETPAPPTPSPALALSVAASLPIFGFSVERSAEAEIPAESTAERFAMPNATSLTPVIDPSPERCASLLPVAPTTVLEMASPRSEDRSSAPLKRTGPASSKRNRQATPGETSVATLDSTSDSAAPALALVVASAGVSFVKEAPTKPEARANRDANRAALPPSAEAAADVEAPKRWRKGRSASVEAVESGKRPVRSLAPAAEPEVPATAPTTAGSRRSSGRSRADSAPGEIVRLETSALVGAPVVEPAAAANTAPSNSRRSSRRSGGAAELEPIAEIKVAASIIKTKPGKTAAAVAAAVAAETTVAPAKRGRNSQTLVKVPEPAPSEAKRSKITYEGVEPGNRPKQKRGGVRVLFTGVVPMSDDLEALKKSGGVVVEDSPTHVIVPNGKVRRTVKLLKALARVGRDAPRVVHDGWIKAGCPADCTSFAPFDNDYEGRPLNMTAALTRRDASRRGLLAGLTVLCTASVQPPLEDMKEIIEAAGGVFGECNKDSITKAEPSSVVILSNELDFKAINALARRHKLSVFAVAWLTHALVEGRTRVDEADWVLLSGSHSGVIG